MMFGFGRKKSQLEKAIEKDGIEHATDRVAEIVAAKIPNRDIAYRFILEELDGASMGNDASKIYANNSGISPSEYKGALSNSIPEVDGPNGPQQLLAGMSMHLAGNQELMAKFRCKVGEKIMKKFGLGRYDGNQNLAQKTVGAEDVRNSAVEGATRTLGGAYIAISLQIVSIMNGDGRTLIAPSGAVEVAKESLVKLTPEQIASCKQNVAALFCVMVTANSAFDDEQKPIAEHLTNQCKPVLQAIWNIPNSEYSDLEFTLIEMATDWMKKVDGVA
jgi:hypothetical protein